MPPGLCHFERYKVIFKRPYLAVKLQVFLAFTLSTMKLDIFRNTVDNKLGC